LGRHHWRGVCEMSVTRPTTIHHRHQSGFTAVIIASLFIAFAVIAAVAVERNNIVQHITRRDATNEKLTRLSNAIIEYSIANKTGNTLLYPCPAPLNILSTNTAFGTPAVACHTGALPASIDLIGVSAIRGMVPVRILSPYGITIEDTFDAWGNRIMYVVNRRLTLDSTSASPLATAQLDNPTMADARTGVTFRAPDFILISYGRDGRGAFKRPYIAATIACPAASVLRREENCDNDASFIDDPTFISANAASATYFDDVLSYYIQ
jgi:hypothetical protein